MEEITLRGNPYEIRPISAYDAVRGGSGPRNPPKH